MINIWKGFYKNLYKLMFLDIGIGILSAIFVSSLFQVKLTALFVFISILLAFLPDTDAVFTIIKKGIKSLDHRHRNIFHYPIIYFLIGIFIALFIELKFGVFFLINVFGHFLHDSIGIGWGVKWLWPFSRKLYKISFSESHAGKKPKIWFLYEFTDEELDSPEFNFKYGDPNWIRNIYLRPSLISIVELIFFFLSLIILYVYLR